MTKGDSHISRRSAHADFNIALSTVKVRPINPLKGLVKSGENRIHHEFSRRI
jgi:hypothetical protein